MVDQKRDRDDDAGGGRDDGCEQCEHGLIVSGVVPMSDGAAVVVVEVDRDECDACPYDAHAEAFVYASNPSWPAALAFCGHHGTRHWDALILQGACLVDQRHRIEDR